MKYYNITVNGVAYSVSVEETAAGAAPVAAAAPAAPAAPKALRLPLLLPRLLQALLVPLPSRLPCPATFWMSRSRPVHP